MHTLKKLLTCLLIVPVLMLSGCAKEGVLDNLKVSEPKTLVYTVSGEQTDSYTMMMNVNRFLGKHSYQFEMKGDTTKPEKMIWTWTLDGNIIRKALEIHQPDTVTEEAIQECFDDYYAEMCQMYALYSFGDTAQSSKTPDWLTVTKTKTKNKNIAYLMVQIDFDKLDTSKKNVQYSQVSDFVWPRLYDKKSKNYKITKQTLNKAVNTVESGAYLETAMPVLQTDFEVSKDYVKDSKLPSKTIDSHVNPKVKKFKKGNK